ncbi:response regulator [Leptolyngbya sp. FACHB-16]|uniref:hybrid sensor histidine kinase/response regulator n=1 Tax=unclassified Leptolyngbya TaxID=2650499 RepID=UPI0018EF4EC5|nr:response regulator [Leptolyngbya sp. FACHB-16]
MLSEQQQRIMGYFIEEAKDHLNTIEQGLLSLQNTISDPEMAHEVFRAAHSVKGGAAMLGLDSIQQTSHRLEDYFKVLKECPVQVDQRLESLLLNVFDTLRDLLDQLQGPFGLTDDKAQEAMVAIEPTFAQLNEHISKLVAQAGVTPPDDVNLQSVPVAPQPVITPLVVAAQPAEESAFQLIFQSDVPARLRDMLQLFKQPDRPEIRQQLDGICQSLAQAGEQFELVPWVDLLNLTRRAVAHPENEFRALAPVVIREIKQAQEQTLAGQSMAISAGDALLALVPPEPELEFNELEALDFLTDDIEEVGTFELPELGFGLDEAALLEDADLATGAGLMADTDIDFGDLPSLEQDSTWVQEDAFADSSLADELNTSEFTSTSTDDGPIVGMAELNSLADLFEADTPELGMTWQEEEILSDADAGMPEPLELDNSGDFSDLLQTGFGNTDPFALEIPASSDEDDDSLSDLLRQAELPDAAGLDLDLGSSDAFLTELGGLDVGAAGSDRASIDNQEMIGELNLFFSDIQDDSFGETGATNLPPSDEESVDFLFEDTSETVIITDLPGMDDPFGGISISSFGPDEDEELTLEPTNPFQDVGMADLNLAVDDQSSPDFEDGNPFADLSFGEESNPLSESFADESLFSEPESVTASGEESASEEASAESLSWLDMLDSDEGLTGMPAAPSMWNTDDEDVTADLWDSDQAQAAASAGDPFGSFDLSMAVPEPAADVALASEEVLLELDPALTADNLDLDLDLPVDLSDDNLESLDLDLDSLIAATEPEAISAKGWDAEGSDLGLDLNLDFAENSEDLGLGSSLEATPALEHDLGFGELDLGSGDFTGSGSEDPFATDMPGFDLDLGLADESFPEATAESSVDNFNSFLNEESLDFDLEVLSDGLTATPVEETPDNLGSIADSADLDFDLGLGFDVQPEAEDSEISGDLDALLGESALDFDLETESSELTESSVDQSSDDFDVLLGDGSELDFDLGMESSELTESSVDESSEGFDALLGGSELDFDLGMESSELTESSVDSSSEDFDALLGGGSELDFDLGMESSELTESSVDSSSEDFDTLLGGGSELDFDLGMESSELAGSSADSSSEDFDALLGGGSELDFDLGMESSELTESSEDSSSEDFDALLGGGSELDFDLGMESSELTESSVDSSSEDFDALLGGGSELDFDLGMESSELTESSVDSSSEDFDALLGGGSELDFDLGMESSELTESVSDSSGGFDNLFDEPGLDLDLGMASDMSPDPFVNTASDETENLFDGAALDFGLGSESNDLSEVTSSETSEDFDNLFDESELSPNLGVDSRESLDASDGDNADSFDALLGEADLSLNLAFDASDDASASLTTDSFDDLFGDAQSEFDAPLASVETLDSDLSEDFGNLDSFLNEETDLGLDLESSSAFDDELGFSLDEAGDTEADELTELAFAGLSLDEDTEESSPTLFPDDGSSFDSDTDLSLDFDVDTLLDDVSSGQLQEADLSVTGSGDVDGFADLDALLEESSFEPSGAASSEPDAGLDEFADLDALLGDASSNGGVTDTAGGDDFADLEALLGADSPGLATPSVQPAEPISSFPSDEFEDLEKLLEAADNTLGGPPSVRGVRSPAIANRRPTAARTSGMRGDQTMRVSVKNLDNLNNLIGELVVNRNSLEQAEERLRQFLDNLQYQVQQLSDVGQRMRDLYERSLLESSLMSSRKSYQMAGPHQTGTPAASQSHATGVSFDALEMDRFTGFHTLSQEMIELIVRVRESASDIDFVVGETDQVTRNFRQITSQLQESLTRARMVPFAQTADRLPRAVRDISLRCGKQAELTIEGRDTLIDKMILEQLYDPMTHLVNNAITHGIETPEERTSQGKAATGRITVRAFHQGNQTVISVSDDGAGIDPDRVKQKAIERRLITPEQARMMNRLDVYDLLFHHGFSTRDRADDFAGRGVGMDVVRTSLTDIRGVINIDSTVGRGTTFTIRLPLTLSVSKALCCISNRARIAFPMDGVEDMLDVPREQIQINSEGQSCIQWRDQLLPFQLLSDLLKFNRSLGRGSVYGGNQEEDIVSVVVLRSNAGSYLALQVDQVLGEQEIVIKQLEGPVPKPVGIAGATVLGDGRIMPIADVLELIDLSLGRIRREAGTPFWDQGADQIPLEPVSELKTEPTVLIVDDSITVRELLSMTFNKVGYRVEQARDGQEAWEKLRSGLPCDLVFCDIEMPRMDGLELLSRLQKDGHLNRVPIAMLTSRGADRHRQMAIQLGAKGYFTKPYLEEVLLDAAQRMLKGEILVESAAAENS